MIFSINYEYQYISDCWSVESEPHPLSGMFFLS